MIYKFNYIITIHNKEHLIADVLNGIKKCVGSDSSIYPVLDGCTDSTESIIDQFQKDNPELRIQKVYENDVHELRAINAALRIISHSDEKQLNVILQDDVVLNDVLLEAHLESLYTKFSDQLGIVSMRHGGNISSFLLQKKSCIFPIKNYVETIFGHGVSGNLRDLDEGSFIFRDVAIKSPICIPSYLINKVGIPDENYQPWDDIAYCFSSLDNGFRNGILSLPFISEKEWGTMRNKKQQKKHDEIVLKNLETFRLNNGIALKKYFANRIKDDKIYQIWQPAQKYNIRPQYVNFIKKKLGTVLYSLKYIVKKSKG